MSRLVMEILEPGLLTTVQDTGRYGYQRFGVPVSGAMDLFSLRAANVLVGNEQGAACLEMTVVGPRMRFLEDALIALTGGDLAVRIDGRPVPRWRSVRVGKHSVLTSDSMVDGMRAYLAVAGGIDVPEVMGSRSTYMASRIGGLNGRALKSGDMLSASPPDPETQHEERGLPEDLEPVHYGHSHVIRAVIGPQAHAFRRGCRRDTVRFPLRGPRSTPTAWATGWRDRTSGTRTGPTSSRTAVPRGPSRCRPTACPSC